MIVLACRENCRADLVAIAQQVAATVQVLDYSEALQAHEGVSCVLISSPQLSLEELGRVVLAARHRLTTRFVLLVETGLRELQALEGILFEAVLPANVKAPIVRDVLIRSCSYSAVDRAARDLAVFSRGPEPLLTSLVTLCRADPPIRSVQRLAALCACDRRELSLQWRTRHGGLRNLSDVVKAVLILRAVELKQARHVSWEHIAVQLNVSVNLLRRQARYQFDRTLGDLADRSGADRYRLFYSRFLANARLALGGRRGVLGLFDDASPPPCRRRTLVRRIN